MTATELHREAMNLAERGFLARRLKKFREAQELLEKALKRESEAAVLSDQPGNEPTRSVLYRSAATLAYECGRFRWAGRLVRVALKGQPPAEVAQELQALQAELQAKLAERHRERTRARAGEDHRWSCADCGGHHVGPTPDMVESELRAWLRDVHGLSQKLDEGDLVGCAAGDELDVCVVPNGCDEGTLLWIADLFACEPALGERREGAQEPVVYVRWSASNGFTFQGPA